MRAIPMRQAVLFSVAAAAFVGGAGGATLRAADQWIEVKREKKPDEARAAFAKAAERNSTSAFVHYRLAALLWAPKAGYETRSDLNRRWVTVRDKTQEVGRSVRDRAKEVGQTVIDTTDAIGTEVKGWKDLRTEAAPDSASTDEAAADENAETEEKDGETDSTP